MAPSRTPLNDLAMTRGPGATLPNRLRHRARIYLSESPTFYLPLARLRYPGPSPQVLGPATELVIDGYTRCASTFVVYAFQLAQERPVRVAHHLHATAQLVEAVRCGLPVLAVIREPRGAILSQLVREPKVSLRDALVAYARFYEQLLPYRQGMVVGEFGQLTGDLGAVVRRLNTRFGTSWAQPQLDDEMLLECRELVTARSSLSPILLSFESGLVSRAELRAGRRGTGLEATYGGGAPAAEQDLWVPSAERDRAKVALSASWDLAPLRLRRRAEDAYDSFVAEDDPATLTERL
jgi:hypothetical protein